MANSVYTDIEGRLTIDIDAGGFAVLYSISSVTWNLACQYKDSNITDICELFSGSGNGYEWRFSGAGPKAPLTDCTHITSPRKAAGKAGCDRAAVQASALKG